MAAPYVFERSSLTASLANNASGTTFAAKARAAELNAVRSRKPPKEMETGDEIPLVAPVALGALKFTRPRNRGRGWKALNLEELSDEFPQGDEAFGGNAHDIRFYNPKFTPNTNYHSYLTGQSLTHENIAGSRISYRPTSNPALSYQDSMDSPQSQSLEKAAENIGLAKENLGTSLVGDFLQLG